METMSLARHLTEQYLRRTRQPGDNALDAPWQFQHAVLRDMLTRLEVILEDEGVAPETIERVIRCMLYGAPSPSRRGTADAADPGNDQAGRAHPAAVAVAADQNRRRWPPQGRYLAR